VEPRPEHAGIAAIATAIGAALARYLPKRRQLPAGESARVRELEAQLEAARDKLLEQRFEGLHREIAELRADLLRENGSQQRQLDVAKKDLDALGAKARELEHRIGRKGGNMGHTFEELLASKTLRGLALEAPLLLSSDAGPTELIAVLEQFKVESSARYQRDEHTFCNLFLWDGTRACGCEVPHWVFGDGTPATPYQMRASSKGQEMAHELNANDVFDWLASYGAQHGWERLDYDAETHDSAADQAVELANNGGVVIFAWKNPTGGPGHVGFVRPSDGELRFAQAGAENGSDVPASHVFTSVEPTFYARSRA
jgi:hypothetical protein